MSADSWVPLVLPQHREKSGVLLKWEVTPDGYSALSQVFRAGLREMGKRESLKYEFPQATSETTSMA